MPRSRGTDDYGAQPKKKRSKSERKPTSGMTLGLFKNVRGRRGALKGIVEMPLDILYEAFMYLTSVEVLHLSRTCKALRRILMTKSAECVWKQARYNLDDFPDRLDDLNEAQLAAFVFSALCDYCNKRKGLYFFSSTFRRCCRTCIDVQNGLIVFRSLMEKADRGDPYILRYVLKDLLPSIHLNTRSEALVFNDYFFEIDRYLFCERSANNLLHEYKKLAFDARKSWLEAKQAQRTRRIQYGSFLELWLKDQNEKCSAQRNNVRQRRYEAIEKKLIDLGWERELRSLSIKDWPSVKQPKELTDRIWENIKNEIIRKLGVERVDLEKMDHLDAKKARRELLRKRLRELEKTHFYKQFFLDTNCLGSVQFEDTDIFPLIQAPTSEEIEFPDSLLLKKVHEWQERWRMQLRALVNASPTQAEVLHPRPIDPLSLATTFFRRWSEFDLLQYPELVVDDRASVYRFSDKAFHAAKALLEASGLEPDTTIRKVVETDFYIECNECAANPDTRSLMTWQTAIVHILRNHGTVESPRLQRAILNETERSEVEKVAVEKLKISGGYKDFECVRCEPSAPPFVGNASDLVFHVEQIHGVAFAIRYSGALVYFQDFVIADYSGFRRQPSDILVISRSNH